ncbi:WD repeat-containing protein 26-like isoform X3 [Iris pallida]|uniref:WD repeat-containing protein 26-like isoform X3 n=1 Tax=Iris pallida TaxID=29817 RepID=A0AAX6FVA2_IRIPA|nr:WD repeat-containing protein 26-like isoform X3 [Iris pallida]
MKSVVEAMIKIMSKQLRGTGITVNCIVPEAIAMDIFFTGKSGEAVRIATGVAILNAGAALGHCDGSRIPL